MAIKEIHINAVTGYVQVVDTSFTTIGGKNHEVSSVREFFRGTHVARSNGSKLVLEGSFPQGAVIEFDNDGDHIAYTVGQERETAAEVATQIAGLLRTAGHANAGATNKDPLHAEVTSDAPVLTPRLKNDANQALDSDVQTILSSL